MSRLIVLLLLITLLSLGLDWVAGEPGHVVIDWGNYHIETSLLAIIAAVAVAALFCVVIYTVVFYLLRSPQAWKRGQLARRQTHGLAALTHAFAAIATQDIRSARKHIGKAQTYLPHQPLTLMLSAQIAKLEGNDAQARLHLEHMLKAEGTEFIALRGLTETARRQRNHKQALAYAEKALSLKPQDSWLITTLAGLYTQSGRTQDALRLIEQSSSKRYLSKTEARDLSCYVLYENARTLTEQKRWDFAIAMLEDVRRKSPHFVPAAALLAQAYSEHGETKRALKTLDSAWRHAPHPDLTQAMLACLEKDKTDRSKTLAALEKIAANSPDNRENRYLRATLALKQRDSKSAIHILQLLVQEKETLRACRLMSEAETLANNPEESAEWMKRATTANAEPTWICGECHHADGIWHLVCPECGGIGTY